MSSKKAVLLINLGTPDRCDAPSIRRYLRQFLNDKRVIDLPWYIRWPLVNLLIIPFRLKKTMHAYQQVWTATGSPLLTNSQRIQQALSTKLGSGYQVELAMRYGNPSIELALAKMQNCDEMMILPLFPQYSSAATGSAIEECLSHISQRWNIHELHIKRDFYCQPKFIRAYAEIIKQHLINKDIDLIIFSYHGLPDRHITKSDCNANCDRINACPVITDANRFCYRAQCYAASRLIAVELGLTAEQYRVSFQSRLGKTPWIKPYTDELLPALISKGIKNIAMVSPSFVADCLETLEEINIRTRQQWTALGGSDFIFIPCVNDHSVWIDALVEMVVSL